jgi:gluconokinase
MKVPCSPYVRIEGIVYFPRMLDKIRLHAAGELREDLHANLGKGFDERCCDFLQVDYDALAAKVRAGLSDREALDWCFAQGFRPSDEQIEVWSSFMSKRGWNDEVAAKLAERVAESGFQDRDDILVMFDYLDADEGRPTGGRAVE